MSSPRGPRPRRVTRTPAAPRPSAQITPKMAQTVLLVAVAAAHAAVSTLTVGTGGASSPPAAALAGFRQIEQVCSTCEAPPAGGGLRVVCATLANLSASAVTPAGCGAACLASDSCISFNFPGCQLNRYAEGYTVVPTAAPSGYWLRDALPGEAVAAAAAAPQKVPHQLAAPTGNVTVARDGVLGRSMEISVDYLLRNYHEDNMLWWFRWRAAGMTGPSPPGAPQGWDRCTDNLRKEAGKLCLKGSVASTFLMGAGGLLRWPVACCSGAETTCCAGRTELRRRFDAVLDGIERAAEPNGFAAAFGALPRVPRILKRTPACVS